MFKALNLGLAPLLMARVFHSHGCVWSHSTGGAPFSERLAVYSAFCPDSPERPPRVVLSAGSGAFSASLDLGPDEARALAAELVEAAGVIDPMLSQWKAIAQGKFGEVACSSQ